VIFALVSHSAFFGSGARSFFSAAERIMSYAFGKKCPLLLPFAAFLFGAAGCCQKLRLAAFGSRRCADWSYFY
jgi:hypothetical protein